MTNLFSRFVRDESGATAIEYGLIAALIAVVIIGAVSAVGTGLTNTFTTVSGSPWIRSVKKNSSKLCGRAGMRRGRRGE